MIRTLSLLMCLIATPLLAAEPITGKVVSLADGNTLTVLGGREEAAQGPFPRDRLPEVDPGLWDEGPRGAGHPRAPGRRDRHRGRHGPLRIVGKVRQDDTDVNRELVLKGWAWRYTQFDKKGEYTAAQVEAKTTKRRPWGFRRKK